MTEPTPPPTYTPAIGDTVAILEGMPYEATWDETDRDAKLIGLEGVITRILGPDWPARYTVTLPDGRTESASRVRLVDDVYRAEKAAHQAADDRLDLRRLRLLDTALRDLADDPTTPDTIRARLSQINSDTAHQAWQA
jgi:hypothetical protein